MLITGESGVGKELVARAIHRNSNRRDEAFVQVNCAAIPEELIESELFGHEKGSFTGATEKQIGKFELAHKGTIFLDEVGDMSLRTQAKVLRVLQEGEVERIGSQKTIQVDVRVIAATNKDLEEEIEKGRFREDLFFRLSVVPIRVPPLRERPEDIPPLVEHFVRQFCAENNVQAARLHRRRRSRRSPATPGAATCASSRTPSSGSSSWSRTTRSRPSTSPRSCGGRPRTPAPAPGRRAGTLRGLQGGRGAGLPRPEAARERLEHLGHRRPPSARPRSNLYKKLEAYGISQEKDG